MKKNVWIFNHYATNMYLDKGGRHYWFAKYLKKAGYNPVIFCANTVHGFDTEIDTEGKKCILKRDEINGIPFVFIKVPPYKGNGISRIKNMVGFYHNLFPVTKLYAQKYHRPDVILASSVHPLTLVAGIRIAKKMGVKCICEVRDLWPESIVVYGKLKRQSFFTKVLYQGEKWIYKKANALIFTMAGGKDYISERGWGSNQGGPINLKKVYHINNGMDLPEIEKLRKTCHYHNEKFEQIKESKIIYTGSIRMVNNLGTILDVSKYFKNMNVKFCIFGDGDKKDELERRIKEEKIDNVILFGKVDKKFIPDIVSQASILLLYCKNMKEVTKYGISQNKSFDYLASGRAILSNIPNKYSIIQKYDCGIEEEMETAESISICLKEMLRDKERLKTWGEHSAQAAKDFSFEKLTCQLIEIIENLDVLD